MSSPQPRLPTPSSPADAPVRLGRLALAARVGGGLLVGALVLWCFAGMVSLAWLSYEVRQAAEAARHVSKMGEPIAAVQFNGSPTAWLMMGAMALLSLLSSFVHNTLAPVYLWLGLTVLAFVGLNAELLLRLA